MRSERSRAIAIACAAVWTAGCASTPASAPRAPDAVQNATSEERARVQSLATDESEALDALAATDARFARRLGAVDRDKQRTSAVKALVEGDEDAAVQGGSLDLFSFAARGRALDEAAKIVARSPAPTKDDPRDVSGIARPRLERELLDRVVIEERARLDEERDLPRGASALVRGIVETWEPPRSSNAASSRDAWLSRRLDEVRASLRDAPITRALLLELDDALDPLERLTIGSDFPETTKSLAHLRVALEGVSPAPTDDVSWPRVEGALKAHLGIGLSAPDLRARLEYAERTFRAEATARLARAGVDERAVSKAASELALKGATCGGDAASSRVRAIAPAAERAPICGALRSIHDAGDDASRAAVAVALHDDAVIGLWAMAIHEAKLGPSRATAIAHPFFGAPPEREAKWVRFAAARPVAAIGAGLAAELLARDPDAAPRWFTFGDAPLDVVEREMFSASPPPPASPRP